MAALNPHGILNAPIAAYSPMIEDDEMPTTNTVAEIRKHLFGTPGV